MISWRYSTLRGRACQSTTGLCSTCPQTEVNIHPVSSGATYDQFANSPAINDFLDGITATNQELLKFLRKLDWARSNILAENPSTIGDVTSTASRATDSKHHAINRLTKGHVANMMFSKDPA